MTDAKVFGFFSILLGGTIIVLSSFLEAIPLFLIVGVLTGSGIVFVGITIVSKFASGTYCPECGEVLSETCHECSVCGHHVSNKISPSLLRRLLH
ncbi:MAG: hypothetical protein DRJ08_02100 [Acidobacteria bacterium]|nr:MAG: hypothetical protein DRJ08_02100 [Acidobacteriota bacterium]